MRNLAVAIGFVLSLSSTAFAGNALICTSDSTDACKGRSYCCFDGMNDSDGDKYCQKLGCRRGGTSSCPTAANVSSCGTRDKASTFIEMTTGWRLEGVSNRSSAQ